MLTTKNPKEEERIRQLQYRMKEPTDSNPVVSSKAEPLVMTKQGSNGHSE
jgi:hypothetical protein